MSRAYVVYLLMALLLVGGLSLIMTLGEARRAPDDLSGEWYVRWDKAPPNYKPIGKLRIDQSGRFFTLRFEGGPAIMMKLDSNWRGSREGRYLWMSFIGDSSTLVCTGSIPPADPRRPEDLMLELHSSGTFTGYASRKLDQSAAAIPATQPLGTANAR